MNSNIEWLETNGLGGFAMGTDSGDRSRRYHCLLMTDRQQERTILVNGLEVWLETASATYPLSTQVYDGGTRFPDSQPFIEKFTHYPCPTWSFQFPDGTKLRQEYVMPQGHEAIVIRWSLIQGKPVKLHVRPLLSCRDYHSLQHENDQANFSYRRLEGGSESDATIIWQPYANKPQVIASVRGNYEHKPAWYRHFYYHAEQQRGLDFLEDLASPGEFHIELGHEAATMSFSADQPVPSHRELLANEATRRNQLTPLKFAANQYIVRRDDRDTIIAGYPWFTDWGRDTFISLRGLCLASGELEVAKNILLAWSDTVSEGMLPNRFPDGDHLPEYNSVDASLWFIIAAHEFLSLSTLRQAVVNSAEEQRLVDASEEILSGYFSGTRHEIHMDDDGLIAAGEPGVQLTWMDAKVGDWVVTPRIGKPVEIQALWLNSLWLAGRRNKKWSEIFDRTLPTFRKRFWNESAGTLYDIVDVGHAVGVVDTSFRPNQILAVGGLPYVLFEGKRARSIVDGVEEQLWTPLGLRTLAPEDPSYRGQYGGGIYERDGAYHQGTAWPWLIGPFVEAWLRVRGNAPAAVREANQKFWRPIEEHMTQYGLGHVTEIANGDAPHVPGGCPFQAWSLAEYIRVCKPAITGRVAK